VKSFNGFRLPICKILFLGVVFQQVEAGTVDLQIGAKLRVQTQGKPFGLRFENDSVVSYCDRRGGQSLNLHTIRNEVFVRGCPPDSESNSECENLGMSIEYLTPGSGNNDALVAGGFTFILDGRILDCAADGKAITTITFSGETHLDPETGIQYSLDSEEGERIVTRAGWSAWSGDSTIGAAYQWKIFSMPSIGFQGAYPSDVFVELSDSTTSESRKKFKGTDAVLSVSGSTVEPKRNLKSEYAAALKAYSSGASKVSYKVFKDVWFVISGVEGDDIYYRKTGISGKHICTWELKYNRSQKKVYDPVVKNLVGTFGPIPK